MGALSYLKLFGTTAGAWALVKSSLAAQAKLAKGEGDAGFYKQKIATTTFYADQILPQTSSFLRIMKSGASALAAADIALA